MSKDNLSSLYNGLIKKGYSVEDIGDEATFRTKMADKNNRKQLYDYVSSRGDFRIGDYDSYEKRLTSVQEEQPQQTEQPQQQTEIPAVVDTAQVQAPELPAADTVQQQAEKPLPKAKRKSLREQVGGGMAIAVPDDVEMAAKFADSPQIYDPNANIQRALAEGKLDTIINEDEEKRISAEFKPKPVVNPADIYENYSNRFSLTERGKQLSSELSGISQEIQNRYANEFLSSDEYRNLQEQYKGEELDKKANEAFSRLYSGKIDNELQPYVKAYLNEAYSRYGQNIEDDVAAYNEDLRRKTKDQIASDVSSLDKSVNAQLEENHRKLSARAGSGGSAFNALMASASYNAGSAQDRKAKAELEAARQLVDESNNIISEARKKGKTNFVAGLGRGLSDAVFDANTWSFGLQDMRDASVLVDALDKFDRGEALTESEQTLMDAAVANMAVNAYYYSDLGRGYKAGTVSGQSIPFMLEFAINPVSASGSAIAKNILKYGMKKFGKSAVKNNAAKFAARLVGDAAAAAAMTGTSSAARVTAGTMERAGGDIQLDESGTGYAGRTGQMGTGEALGKSFASTFLENQSEMVFNAFSGLGSKIWKTAEKYVPGGTAAIMDNAVMGKAGEIYRKIKSNPTLKEVARRTQFHGLGEEYLEEVYNNFANIPLGEMTLEEATDLDNNIDTFLGLAPTSVAFGIIGLGGLAAQKAEHRKKLKAAFGNMTRIEKNRLAKLEELAEKGGNEDIKTFIRETMLDTSLTPEEKKAEIEYAYNLAVGNAIDDVEAAQQEEVTESNAAASEEGAAIYAEHNPETMRQTVLRREVAEQRLVDAGFSIDKLKATPVNERQELLSRIDEENTQLVVDFFDAYDREEAMNEALDTAHEEEVSQARSMLQDIVLPNQTVTVVPLGQYGTEQAQYGVVVSGIDAQGNPTQSNGAVVTYPVQIVNGTPDFSTIDKDNAIVAIPKSYTDAMVFSPDEAFNGMLTAYQQDAAILEGTPVVPGAQFPVMLDDGSMQNVTVAGTAPTGESVVVLPDGKTASMSAEELSTRKRNAELAPIMAEQAEEEQIQQQAVQEAATAGYSDEVRNLQPQVDDKLVVDGRNAVISEIAPDGLIVNLLSESGDITGTKMIPLETYYDYKQSQFNQQNNVQTQSDKDTAVSGSVLEEPVEGNTADSSGDTTATEEVQQAEEKDYPVDEAGEPAFLQMQPQRTVQLLTDTFAEDAASFVSDRLSAAQKAAEKAAKKSPKALRFNERAKELSRIRQEREDAAREVEYWQNISSLIAPEVQPQQTEQPQQVEEKPKPKAQAQPSAPSLMEQAEEISRKNQERLAAMTEEEIAAAQKKVQENIDKGKYDRKPASRRRSRYNDEDVAMGEAYTPMEHVLREIATGRITFQWGDSKLGGTQGLGSHLGLSGSNAERQKLIWALSGEGYAPEVAAEIIHADMPSAMQELVTDQDVFNMILDAFSQYGSPSRMFEAAQQLHGIDMESQPGYEEDMERQQLEWEAYHNNMSVKDWTTLVDIVEEELEYQFQTLTDEDINAIFEEIYNEEYGTGRNEIEGAEGTEQSADSEGSNEVQPQQQSDNETADGRSEVRPEETAPSDEQGSGTLSQPGFTVEKRYHKKDNKDIFAVNFTERMDRDIFLDAKNEAKNRGGYYSSFGKGGFIFETEEAARNFGELIMAGIVGRNVGRAIEAARARVEQNPTEAQKEAGNYRKGHITIDGYNITLENPKGSERSGTDKDGNKWSVTMNNDYGYIRGTEGVDGDHIDVFLSDNPESGKVFVVDQVNEDGSFDEHKVMYGFDTRQDAEEAYLANYSPGWTGLGQITEVSKDQFKKWIESSHRKTKPFAEYKSMTTPKKPEEVNGYRKGDKVYYGGKPATIYDFEYDGHPVLDTGLAPVLYTIADWEDVSAYKEPKQEKKSSGMQQISVEGLFNDLKTKGTARFADNVIEETPAYGSQNKVVSTARYEELKKRMRNKLNNLNVGYDPEIIAIGAEMAAYHIEAGARTFIDFAKRMITDMGDEIRPYLKSIYSSARHFPGMEEYKKTMTPESEYDEIDINTIKLEEDEQTGTDTDAVESQIEAIAGEAERRIEEAETTEQVEQVNKELDEQIETVDNALSSLGYVNTLHSGMRVILKDGRNVMLTVVMRQGEQVSATEFSEPQVTRLYASYKGKLVDFVPEDIDVDATVRYNSGASDVIRQEEKPASELSGNSAEHQERAIQESKAVAEIGRIIRDRALASVEGNDVEPLSMKDVKKILGGYTMLSDMSATDMQELVELAMTNETRNVALEYINSDNQKSGYDLIVSMYNMQPLLNARDSTRFERQQYSTPTPFGYVMGQFAQADKKVSSVLEPSAGNGALTITFPSSIVHVNDIDERRLANLRTLGYGEVTNQDALIPFSGSVDVVMTNPPFGSTTTKELDNGQFKINSLEGLMAINALESMKDDGRAAIVIGGNTSYRENGAMQNKDMRLFSYLYTHYNVVDVINLDGEMYKRNGTKYDVRIILINGRKPDASKIVAPPVKSKARAEQVKSFEELYNRIQDDIRRIQQVESVTSGTEGKLRTSDTSGGGENRNVGNSGNVGERRGSAGGSQKLGTENNVAGTETASSTGSGRQGTANVEGLDNGNRSDAGSTGNVPGPQQVAERGGSTESTDERTTRPDTTDRGDNTGRSRLAVSLGDEKVSYPNRSQSGTLMSVVPANQAQVLADSLADIGDVDQFLVDELGYSSKDELFGYLAAEQIDSVSLAINQMSKGNGFIIGDMTGVGKGRQGAALIRYAVRKGYKPIYFTQKPALFSDNYRDLADIGSGELRPFIIGSDPKNATITDAAGNVVHKLPSDKERKRVYDYILKNGTLPDEYDYVITTYSQINNGTKEYEATADGITSKDKSYKKKSPSPADRSGQERRDVIEALSRDNIMILDESHTAGGSGGGSMFMQYIMPGVKGVTFLSATFAKRADNMPIYAMKTDLAKSGITQQELIEAIAQGGVTLQEIMSKQLVQSGQMIRRERSFNGVTIDWLSVSDEEDAIQRKQFDEVSAIFSDIRAFQKDYINPLVENRSEELADEGGYSDLQKGTVDLGASNTPFASKMYNLVNQLLFSLKADAVANRVIDNLKNGFKPVISFTNTMEGFLDEAPKDTPMDVVPNFSLTLLKALDGVMRYTETDIKGEKVNMFYTPEQLGEDGKKKYYEIKDKIENLSANLPISPMDAIKTKIEEAGYKVGEITGRNLEMVRNEDGKYVVRNRKDKDKKSAAHDFNNGQIDVLMINKSGSTGISLHASPKFQDQRQRVMVFAQFQSDINDEVQMRGRIDRTGQIYRGKYEYIMSSIPAEQRLQMMFKAKLKSLDANTTSSQKSKFNEMQVTDFLNKYGDEVTYQYMVEHPELSEKLGDPLNLLADNGTEVQIDETGKEKMKDSAAKIARYLPFLPVKEQEEVFKEITDAYAVKIQLLNDAGENDLEITTMPLKAKTLSRKIWKAGAEPNSGNAFADNTYIEEVEVDVLKKPMKADEIKKEAKRLSEGQAFKEWRESKIKEINQAYKFKIESLKEKFRKSVEEKMAKAKESYVKKSKEARAKGKNEFTDDEIDRMSDVMVDEIKAKANEVFNKQKNAIDARWDNILKILETFEPLKPIIIPTNLEEETASIDIVRGMFVGYKFSKDYSPSSSTAVFATLDGRRKVEIPLKDSKAFNIIRMNTLMQPTYLKSLNIDTWDSFVPTQTRKKAYIVTGNLLQALVDVKKSEKARGYLVSYSTEEGETRQGMLMSESFQPSDLTTSAPIRSRLEQIKRGETVVSEDKRVIVEKNAGWRGGYSVRVPKSKKQGGEFFEDKTLRSLVYGNEFTSKGGYMTAEFDETNLPKVLNRLSNLGVKVADKAKLKDAKDEDIRFRTEDSEIRFRSSSDLVVDISEDLESLINEKPVKREPTYNADNIGSIFYSMSGKYMKRLPQPKDRHVLTEGTIDIDKAIEVYNKVLPVYEDMKNELIDLIPNATMAARREIAAYIEAINNNIDYYKELSEGKDVWRTRPLYRFEDEYGLTEEVAGQAIERFENMVPNHPEIHIAYTEEDLRSLKEVGVAENEIQDIIENALDNPNVGGVFISKANIILMFPSKAIDESSFESCLWHENSHYVLHNSKSINYERLTDDSLMYLKDKYPENYNIIIKGYPKEHWNEEGVSFLMQNLVDKNGAEKIINAKFEGNDNISRLFTTILNEFKDETKRRGTVRNKLRHVQAEASDGKREENNGNDGGRRSGKPEIEQEVGRRGENESERTRQERIKSFITEQAAKLNIPVTVYTSIDEIPQGAARRALERGLPVKGWYHDGQIAIYLPNATGMEDIKATLLHEGVAHYGLRKMIGEENFNAFMDGIYAAASPEVRKEIVRLLPKYNYNMRTAVEEYLATLAESGTIEPTFWEKVKQLFRSILENLGFTIELTDNDLRYLLWESRNNLRASNSPIDVAKETMMRKKLGIGMFRTKDTEHVESKEKQGIVEKAKADGTYMKAPNGKSSNLNERQWVQVRTKAFKNWFGDWENNAENASKVVDENGEPKVVQHGTPIEELYEFDINHLGDNTGDEGVYGAGFYFGNLDEEGFSIYGDNIIQAYLNIRSPYNIDADSDILDFIASLNFASMREVKFKGQSKENSTIGELIDYINEVKNKYDIGDYSDLIESFRGIFGESADEEVIMRKISLKFAFPLSVNTFINDCIGGIDFTKALKRNGNDGVIVWSRKDYSELVAFYPTQIKSATDNTGNFNPENPDIRFRFEQRPALIKSYDAAIDNSTFRFQEAFQDSMLSLKVLQELIEEQSGMKARSFENAYTAENRLSSVNKVDNERYLENFFKPLLEQIDKLAKMSDRKSVEDYIYAKSGLERNELFLNREADKILNEKTKELDESLATSSITQKQYEKELKELEEARDKFIAAGKDYSGLTGLVLKEYEDELNSMPDEAARAKREKEIEKEYKNHAENIVSEFENLIPSAEVDKLWQLIKAANDENLRKQFDSGMLSAEKYEELRDMMPHYVPLRGWQESIAEDFYDYTRKESPVQKEKSAKGRKSLADNPIANIALSAQNAIILGNRNKMKQRFFNFIVNRPNELVTIRDQWYAKTIHTVHDQMEPVYPDIKETDDSATIQRKLEDFENDMKSLEEQGLARRKRMPLGVELKMKSGQKPEHMVSVMINGQEYVIYINGNPRAAQALNGKTNPEGEENIFWEYYNKAKRLYGGGLTSNNPDFVAANFVRDSIHSATMQFLNNGFGSSARFVLNTPKSFKAVFRGVLGKYKPGSKTDQYFQEFIQNGGETGYTAIHTIEDYKREYEKALNEVKGFKVVASAGKKGLEGVIKALEVANRIAEDVNRFNAYMSSREAGKTIEESIDAAKNITVNFNKKGALGKGKGAWAALAWFMNKWILFFNPAVQGLYQVGQSAANNKKRVAGTLATIAASGFIMPYLNALLVSAFGGDDKDDYFYQTDYTRMNNWLIFTGNGYAKIPLPPFFREIYGMGDVFYRLMTNRITPERAAVATLRQLQSAIGFINLIPEGEPNIKEAVSGIMPDLIAPLMDVALNRDFTGRDIAKDTDWTKNLPEYERIYKGVSPVYVEFSRMLNQIGGDDARRSPLFGTFINPAYMEHLITSYTGGIGRTISNLTGAAVDLATGEADNIEFRTIPIINRFGSPVTERSITASVNRVFYDYLERYEAMKVAEKRYKEFIKDGRTEYRDELEQMKSNGESELIRYFDMKMKTVRKLQNILKDNPDNKKVEQRIIELKSEMILKAKNILK